MAKKIIKEKAIEETLWQSCFNEDGAELISVIENYEVLKDKQEKPF